MLRPIFNSRGNYLHCYCCKSRHQVRSPNTSLRENTFHTFLRMKFSPSISFLSTAIKQPHTFTSIAPKMDVWCTFKYFSLFTRFFSACEMLKVLWMFVSFCDNSWKLEPICFLITRNPQLEQLSDAVQCILMLVTQVKALPCTFNTWHLHLHLHTQCQCCTYK